MAGPVRQGKAGLLMPGGPHVLTAPADGVQFLAANGDGVELLHAVERGEL